MRQLFVTLRALERLALSIWIGTLVFLGFGVAGTIFRFLPSRNTAGQLNGLILAKMNQLETAAAAILIVALTQLWFMKKRKIDLFRLALAVLMAGVMAYYAYALTPRLTELRAEVGDFDHPPAAAAAAAKEEFDRGHRLYSMLTGSVLIAGVVSLALGAADSERP